MTKLQCKRAAARWRRLIRRMDRKLLDYHVALDPKHEWMVVRSVYWHKRRRHAYGGWGLRGVDHRSINIARDSLARTFNAYAERWPR